VLHCFPCDVMLEALSTSRCLGSAAKTSSANDLFRVLGECAGEGSRYERGGIAKGDNMIIGRKFGREVFGRGGRGGGEDGGGI